MSEEPLPSLVTALRDARVSDEMSSPVVTCLPTVPLREVAELMTRHRIHSVVVHVGPAAPGDESEEWGVLSELDMVGAACLADPEVPAGQVAATPPVVIGPDESLERAALLMAEYQVTHLIAVEAGRAAGVISALDVARALVRAARGGEPPAEPEGPAAKPGDRLVIRAHHIGGTERDAEILEARGPGGGAPYLVRWEDSGRVSLLYPGSDAEVRPTGT